MSNIIEFSATPDVPQDGLHCWLCQKPISARALFCHQCGTIQPVRKLDHFSRLGLETRIDIDADMLERQYAALKRALDPNRFAIRGAGEKGHASKHLEALEKAYDTLRDPLRRGRYWLVLHEQELAETGIVNPMIAELQQELESAIEADQCDRVARKAGQAMEQGIMGLMQSLRSKNWRHANATLLELDSLESILNEVRARRGSMAISCNPESDIQLKT